ncbi:MAG: ribbon-helix-helix protein, CopG family [Deltaproteobacteria bacterium]|nr:ribbon-helix-helix protein, CopG family [Deltaproteobacteria bacterium]
MRTVQMTLDEQLVAAVDKAARRLGLSRSAFTREALAAALRKEAIRELERRHREGYRKQPARAGELDGWESEQVWPE